MKHSAERQGLSVSPKDHNLSVTHCFLLFTLVGIFMASLLTSFIGCSDDDDSSPTATFTPTATPTPDLPLDYEIHFTEYSEPSGIDIAENGPHGVIAADVNNDDYDDVFITRCCDGMTDFLYINQKNGTFVEEGEVRGVSDPGGVTGGSHGSVFFDYDNDGDFDLFCTGNTVPDRMYENNGSGYFTDVTAIVGMRTTAAESRGAIAADIDGDGDQDVFSVWLACYEDIGDYVTHLYVNSGNGFFVEDDGSRGLLDMEINLREPCSGSQGVTFSDVDLDGDIDIYLNRIDLPNRLFINNGLGYFQDEAESRGVANSDIFSNGAEFVDLDNDGDFDMVLQDLDQNYELKFFLNNGNGTFTNATEDYNYYAQAYSGLVADFDNDGDLDYYVIQRGHYDASKMIMFENDGYGYLTPVHHCGADFLKADARSATALDFDNDGDLDIMLVANRGGSNFLRNDANNNRFLKIKLIGAGGTLGAYGAAVRLYAAGHLGESAYLRGIRHAVSGQGYLSQSSPVIHFGLGNITQVADIEVTFSTGHVVRRYGIERGKFITISADEGSYL